MDGVKILTPSQPNKVIKGLCRCMHVHRYIGDCVLYTYVLCCVSVYVCRCMYVYLYVYMCAVCMCMHVHMFVCLCVVMCV